MKLLERVAIGKMVLKNRCVMAPMGPEIGNFDKKTNSYYLRRAQGGASMIMLNVMATELFDGHGPSSLLNEETYDGFKSLVEQSHDYDCKVCIQIMAGVGLGQKADDRIMPASASAIPLYPGSDLVFDELTKDEIKTIHQCVLDTVSLASKAGVDAVEIHAYGGYLTDRFMSKRWNIRTDEYGGTLENRMRFLIEMIDLIQTNLGMDLPLIVKFTPSHYLPVEYGYRDFEEGLEIAKILEQKNVHALHVDTGCHDNWWMAMPPIYQQETVSQMEAAKKIKDVVSIPVISNGRLGDVSKAEQALQNNWLDIVGVGRNFLSDPDFLNKIKEHKTDEIRYCIYCNEGCIKAVSEGQTIGCALNAEAGRETIKQIEVTNAPKKVLIIGAGPAGCEAAIRAKSAGHDVELWEKEAYLGGNFYNACQPSFKRDGAKVLKYYKTMLDKLGVRLLFSKQATCTNILEYDADKVIHAAGSNASIPSTISGINQENVFFACDVLQNKAIVKNVVCVIGAGLVGCETAIELANRNRKVTLIEMADDVLPEKLFIQNEMMLKSLLNHPNIDIRTKTKVIGIKDNRIELQCNDVCEDIRCETAVLATGFSPNDVLYNDLSDKIDIVNVGDSVKPRKVLEAVNEAYDAILNM